MINDTQVAIYLDDPRGQVLQVSYEEYVAYWRRIGWTLYCEAPMFKGMQPKKVPALQAGLL